MQTRRLNVQKLVKIDHKRPLINRAHDVNTVLKRADVVLLLVSENIAGVVYAHLAGRKVRDEDSGKVSGQRSKVNDRRSTAKIGKS